MLGSALLSLFACDQPTAPQRFEEALRLAPKDQGKASTLCDTLTAGEGAGMCLLAVSESANDRRAACLRIAEATWRGECWFEIAESDGEGGRWDDAIDACGNATPYESDCARHLWWRARLASAATPALRAALDARFEGALAEIDAEDPDLIANAAIMAAEGATLTGGPDGLQWRARFRASRTISTAACPAGDTLCVGAARKVYRGRWDNALDRQPAFLATLCAGGPWTVRLDPGGDPALLATVAELQAERCR
jgi:hypothetical protein